MTHAPEESADGKCGTASLALTWRIDPICVLVGTDTQPIYDVFRVISSDLCNRHQTGTTCSTMIRAAREAFRPGSVGRARRVLRQGVRGGLSAKEGVSGEGGVTIVRLCVKDRDDAFSQRLGH